VQREDTLPENQRKKNKKRREEEQRKREGGGGDITEGREVIRSWMKLTRTLREQNTHRSLP